MKQENNLYTWIVDEFIEQFGSDEFKYKYSKGRDKVFTKLWWQVFVRQGGLWKPNFTYKDFLERVKLAKEDMKKTEDFKFNGVSDLFGEGMDYDDYNKLKEDMKEKIKETRYPTAYFQKAIPLVDLQFGPKIKIYEKK